VFVWAWFYPCLVVGKQGSASKTGSWNESAARSTPEGVGRLWKRSAKEMWVKIRQLFVYNPYSINSNKTDKTSSIATVHYRYSFKKLQDYTFKKETFILFSKWMLKILTWKWLMREMNALWRRWEGRWERRRKNSKAKPLSFKWR